MSAKNPQSVVVLQEGEGQIIHDVETWWYNDLDLKVRFASGEVRSFPGGVIQERY